jgi:hypothetical protein
MGDLKEQVMNFKTRIYSNQQTADPRQLGVYILAKVIPTMDEVGDVAFAWHWAKNDLCVYNQQEYDNETRRYLKEHKMKNHEGDTAWNYVFKNKSGKMRKAVLTTDIWFKEGVEHATSPVAYLLNQFMGAGLHIAKVKFEDA